MHIGINGYFVGQETTGSGQYLVQLLEALLRQDAGDRYTLLTPGGTRSASGSPLAKETSRLTERRLPLLPIGENLAKTWLEQVSFPIACRRVGVDLAHVPYFASPMRSSVPMVVTVHDVIPLVLSAYRGDLRVRLYMRLVAQAAKRADAIMTDSKAARRDILRVLGVPGERVHVVYLAADPRFRPDASPGARADLAARHDLPERYILYLGGFDQRRNLATLLAGFAEAIRVLQGQRAEPMPALVLAGGLPGQDTDFTPDPRRMIRELGIDPWVRCVGRVSEEDKAEFYRGADLFVFPSSYEGFGLPPLEAMACGTPVIAADATSLPEIVGEGGLLVEAFDPRAWRDAIIALWGDQSRRRDLGQRAIKQAASFSWPRAARETRRVYRETLARRSPKNP